MANVSKITVPILVDDQIVMTDFEIKDNVAREAIEGLANAMYWGGVTTTEITDGSEIGEIVVNGNTITPKVGCLVQYNGEEFAWDGTAWQSLGKNNFGALAFKNTATASYTPNGSVTVNQGSDTTVSVTSITSVGSLPSYTVSGETLILTAGSLPTMGDSVNVVSQSGTRTASFVGAGASITVS